LWFIALNDWIVSNEVKRMLKEVIKAFAWSDGRNPQKKPQCSVCVPNEIREI
jgi:hypothetical protein